MGPRTLVRGNKAGRRVFLLPYRSFNGAAHSRARKSRPNVASSPPTIALQWGRALSCAEICSYSVTVAGTTLLQWGRALSCAEIGAMVQTYGFLTCFNGAA